MKWFIVSDIHGSAYYTKKLIEAYESEKADRMILLGDVLYHGPRNDLPKEYNPKEVAELLNKYSDKILAVRGNCDAEVDSWLLNFPIGADYALLPIDNRLVFITHGHIYNEEKLPAISKGDILLHGHTHVPKCVEHENYTYINPGSVSMPKEGSHHGYMILEDGHFTWKDVETGEIIKNYNI